MSNLNIDRTLLKGTNNNFRLPANLHTSGGFGGQHHEGVSRPVAANAAQERQQVANILHHFNTLGWAHAGYDYIVGTRGTAFQIHERPAQTNGVGNHNHTIGRNVSFVGMGRNITPAAWKTLVRLWAHLVRTEGIKVADIRGHNQFSGHASNACPDINMANLRRDVQAELDKGSSSTPASSANTHTVRSGETLSGIAVQYGTTVKAIQDLNNIKNANVIQIGQVLRLPTGSTSSSNTTAGRRLELRSVSLFANATTNTVANTITGSFWIWNNQVSNGRIRITNAANRVGVAGQITGWIRTTDL